MKPSDSNRRSLRTALVIAVMSLGIVASAAYAAGPKPLPVEPDGGSGGVVVLPVEPDGGIGGEVILPVEPDGGIGN
jgi:hypothetical protein